MAGASADGEINHWPAFVDVLTTVIMVVTFLLVIMSAAVMVLSQRVMERYKAQIEAQHSELAAKAIAKEKGADKDKSSASSAAQGKADNSISSPRDAEAGTSVAQLGNVLRSEATPDGVDRLTIRTRETPDTMKIKVKAIEAAENSVGGEVTVADVLLRVDFEPLAVRYTDENTRQLVDFLKSRGKPDMKYEIWSFAPQTGSVTEAQRLAFFRAAMTRNVLVMAGIKPADIVTQVRVTDAISKDGHNVRVVLKP